MIAYLRFNGPIYKESMCYMISSVRCQVITCRLIFDVIKTLVERFAEADIEVLHHVMKGQTVLLHSRDSSYKLMFSIVRLIVIT